jgi:DNA-binding NarL/FixJ family response regulator
MAIRVLLADDHRVLREGIRNTLTDEGIEVVGEAGDGDEAVRLGIELLPDVCLMDVSMPVRDGVAATALLRRDAPGVRVVMLTMHVDRDIIERSLRAGAVGYMTKDCSADELVGAVRMAATGETALSPQLATTMLDEVRRIDRGVREEDRFVTKREEEVLQLIADGCSTPEVAQRLYISQKTVKNHLASIYEKLDARDRTQAVLRAVRMGIVSLY